MCIQKLVCKQSVLPAILDGREFRVSKSTLKENIAWPKTKEFFIFSGNLSLLTSFQGHIVVYYWVG